MEETEVLMLSSQIIDCFIYSEHGQLQENRTIVLSQGQREGNLLKLFYATCSEIH